MKTLAHAESIEIGAPPEAVFDVIHDYRSRLDWDPFLKEATLIDGDEAGVGVTSRCVARGAFLGLAMDAVYVSFDRPHVAAVRMTRGPWILESFAATLRQDAVGDGRTLVTYRYHLETRPSPLRWVLNPICYAVFDRQVRKRLRYLKRYLEASRSS
jgi:hypothetical protein